MSLVGSLREFVWKFFCICLKVCLDLFESLSGFV